MSVRFSKTRGRNPYRLTVTTQLIERARNAYLKRFSWVDGHADTWAALRDADTLALVIDALAACGKESRATAVLGIEARGFLLGPAVAQAAGLGFVAARKGDGLFAGATHQAARVILSMKGEGVLPPAGITPSRNLPNPTKRFTVTVL